jgi:hypothetical protein
MARMHRFAFACLDHIHIMRLSSADRQSSIAFELNAFANPPFVACLS